MPRKALPGPGGSWAHLLVRASSVEGIDGAVQQGYVQGLRKVQQLGRHGLWARVSVRWCRHDPSAAGLLSDRKLAECGAGHARAGARSGSTGRRLGRSEHGRRPLRQQALAILLSQMQRLQWACEILLCGLPLSPPAWTRTASTWCPNSAADRAVAHCAGQHGGSNLALHQGRRQLTRSTRTHHPSPQLASGFCQLAVPNSIPLSAEQWRASPHHLIGRLAATA